MSLPLSTCAMLAGGRFGAGVLTGAARQVREGLLPEFLFFPRGCRCYEELGLHGALR